MSEQIYKPKFCAFHPKEYIVNFCKNAECLLPLCPTCIKVHTDEHRSEQTYGQFEKYISNYIASLKLLEILVNSL